MDWPHDWEVPVQLKVEGNKLDGKSFANDRYCFPCHSISSVDNDAKMSEVAFRGKYNIKEGERVPVGDAKETAESEVKAYQTQRKCLQDALDKLQGQKGNQAAKERKDLREGIRKCETEIIRNAP